MRNRRRTGGDESKMNQGITNYSLNNRLIQPFPRKVICIFGTIIGVYVMVVFTIDDSLNFLWGVLFAGIGLFSLFIYTKRRRQYYTPLIFTIFYFLGYLLSFSHVLLNKNDIARSGFGAIGGFMFTDSNFFIVMLVVTAGMSGILTVTLIAEKIFRRRRGIVTRKNIEPGFLPKKQLYTWILLWFCFSICLVLLMWNWGIGRTGLMGKTSLPFRLAGFFIYLRDIFIPFCGILLLDICLRGARKRLANLVLMQLIVIGIFGSLGSTSKGIFVFTVFPAILYLFFTIRKNNLSQRLFIRFSAATLVIGSILIFIVSFYVRKFAYTNISWSLKDAQYLLTNLTFSDFDIFEIFTYFMNFLIGSIGGIRELMAVIGSNVSDIEIPVKIFIGMMSEDSYRSISYSVFGFIVPSPEGTAFGIGYGMWGQLFLSGSYLVVYFGTILLVGIVICLEEVFIRKGFYSIALLVSIILCKRFWGSASMFYLSRFAVLLLICYLTTLYILKKMRRLH